MTCALESKLSQYLSEYGESDRGSLRKFTGGYYPYEIWGLRGGSTSGGGSDKNTGNQSQKDSKKAPAKVEDPEEKKRRLAIAQQKIEADRARLKAKILEKNAPPKKEDPKKKKPDPKNAKAGAKDAAKGAKTDKSKKENEPVSKSEITDEVEEKIDNVKQQQVVAEEMQMVEKSDPRFEQIQKDLINKSQQRENFENQNPNPSDNEYVQTSEAETTRKIGSDSEESKFRTL